MIESTQTTSKPAPSTRSERSEFMRTVIYAVVLASIFRSLFFEPFHIPSSSMKSGLLIGDYIFVSKYSYGYSRYSFPYGLPLFHGRIFKTLPKRGDVVVFRPPGMPGVDYIKRVIGLPGDRIQMKDDVLYINGENIPRKRVDDYVETDAESRYKGKIPQYVETLPEGKKVTVLDITPTGPVDTTQEYVVPPGHYFMMGDNRDDSTDSRYLNDVVGYVPLENIVGRAEIIVFSMDTDVQFWQAWRWISGLRTERFFKRIR